MSEQRENSFKIQSATFKVQSQWVPRYPTAIAEYLGYKGNLAVATTRLILQSG